MQVLVRTTQLAEELDRNTFNLALTIVPINWWRSRMGADLPIQSD